ncbi:hypothetical protein CAFE_06520 [Caprobacter fermentans]|uniref:DUF421 domain-containing protein n=1 Tax=Caproicibacter fermentans TaxID=2576756 RepID=A0A6N8HW03_9FIRM|nr:YetF domain-containing protein [Caproicibacter fermentans]MVB09981.1 hypothetical protein [Caproicibacter fermentans]OCN00238.1 hypothetical protein A7X67_09210 [Clostridium sp. W14A]QNK42073.1 DUF421 domain-containing protein [Caproicibacter fermentans]
MSTLVYVIRCVLQLLVTWLGIRIIGKKSIAQMTGYELSGILLLSTVAAEPLVYKIASNAAIGVVTLAVATLLIGKLSLKDKFYNVDSKPSIVVANGSLIKSELKKNQMNVPFLLSLLRLKGYSKLSDVEFAIIEPNGNLSVIPKSQERPVKPKDIRISTPYEGLSLPLLVDGKVIQENLVYAKLDRGWLMDQLASAGFPEEKDVLLAELDSQGNLSVFRENESDDSPKIV